MQRRSTASESRLLDTRAWAGSVDTVDGNGAREQVNVVENAHAHVHGRCSDGRFMSTGRRR
jgi:hypothetical protein